MTHRGFSGFLMRCCVMPVVVAAMAGCAPAAADMVSPPGRDGSGGGAQNHIHPVSGLKVAPLTIQQVDKTHHFRVELAVTHGEQARGLMFREKMADDEGMIFPYNPPRVVGFWMKNTLIPLDMIFIGPDGRIINIIANATPHSRDARLSEGRVKAVLELNGGMAAKLGITPGDLVKWEAAP